MEIADYLEDVRQLVDKTKKVYLRMLDELIIGSMMASTSYMRAKWSNMLTNWTVK